MGFQSKKIREVKITSREETLNVVDKLFVEFDEESLLLNENAEQIIDTENFQQFVNFQIGHEYYAVDISHITEIIKVPGKISFLPSAKKYIIGLINLRGNIIPVVNTHSIFGVSSDIPEDKHRIIIMDISKSLLGFLVDSVSQVIELKREDIDHPMVTLEVERTDYISGETNIDGQLVAILDIYKLVNNEIFEEISENS